MSSNVKKEETSRSHGRAWKPPCAKELTKREVSPHIRAVNNLAEYYNAKCNHLMGELLTTLEATVDDERKLEALRTRVKDIQTLAWEEMNQEIWGSAIWFDKGQYSPIDMQILINKTVQAYLTNYGSALQNIIKAVFVDQWRATALNKEISRLVHKTRVSIHNGWGQMIASAFPETTKKSKTDAIEHEEEKKK